MRIENFLRKKNDQYSFPVRSRLDQTFINLEQILIFEFEHFAATNCQLFTILKPYFSEKFQHDQLSS
jgi:hypothetical protein